jgi:hypothetical protein
MNYLGDFADNSVVKMYFTTHDKDGAAVAPSSAFENTDIRIYKDGSATQKTSVNGIVMTSPFDALVGLHLLSIDTGNDTGDVGFWTTGGEYSIVLIPDETVDGESVISVIGSFSIERVGGAIALAKDIPTNSELATALTSVGLSAGAVDSILDEVVEGALTLRHITKILLAYIAGRSTGGGTVTISFKDQANTKSRIVMTVNADGNRSNVVVDGV